MTADGSPPAGAEVGRAVAVGLPPVGAGLAGSRPFSAVSGAAVHSPGSPSTSIAVRTSMRSATTRSRSSPTFALRARITW